MLGRGGLEALRRSGEQSVIAISNTKIIRLFLSWILIQLVKIIINNIERSH